MRFVFLDILALIFCHSGGHIRIDFFPSHILCSVSEPEEWFVNNFVREA